MCAVYFITQLQMDDNNGNHLAHCSVLLVQLFIEEHVDEQSESCSHATTNSYKDNSGQSEDMFWDNKKTL